MIDLQRLEELAQAVIDANGGLDASAAIDAYDYECNVETVQALIRTAEALRPFAKAGSLMNLVGRDDADVVYTPVIDANFCITAGDLRRAHEALSAFKQEE